jgi:putative membrane protein
MLEGPRNESEAHASARDHLANERTFLAWLRTAVSVISLGIAINRFSLYLNQLGETEGVPKRLGEGVFISAERLGLGLILFGMLGLILSALRYKRTYERLERGTYKPDHTIIWVTTGAVLILGGLATAWLFQR